MVVVLVAGLGVLLWRATANKELDAVRLGVATGAPNPSGPLASGFEAGERRRHAAPFPEMARHALDRPP